MNDYCYIIVDKLSKSYYIGQSTVAIDAQNSRNRMYAHVLTCLGLNGYRGKMEDFTTFIKNKSELSGIDKI